MSDKKKSIDPSEQGDIVKQGYDQIAEEYHRDRDQFNNQRELEDFMKCLPQNATVLDIGCGAGVPVLKTLVKRGYRVKGIDFSEGMLRLAKQNVPGADLILGDVLEEEFEDESFDGIISTYAVIHIHRRNHPALYTKIHRWLKPGGFLLVSTAVTEWEGVDEYYDVPMAWSHPTGNKTLEMMSSAGFEILFDRVVTTNDETHYWILARRGLQ